jgi:hypothetical protein
MVFLSLWGTLTLFGSLRRGVYVLFPKFNKLNIELNKILNNKVIKISE